MTSEVGGRGLGLQGAIACGADLGLGDLVGSGLKGVGAGGR